MKVLKYIKNNRIVSTLIFLLIVYFLTISIFIYQGYANGNDVKSVLEYIQMITVPFSAIGIIVGFISNKKSKDRALNLEKAGYTSKFSEKLRAFMDKYPHVTEIKESYFKADPKMDKLFSNIKNTKKLEFNIHFYQELLDASGVTEDEVYNYVKVGSDDLRSKHRIVSEESYLIGQYLDINPGINVNSVSQEVSEYHNEIREKKNEIDEVRGELDSHQKNKSKTIKEMEQLIEQYEIGVSVANLLKIDIDTSSLQESISEKKKTVDILEEIIINSSKIVKLQEEILDGLNATVTNTKKRYSFISRNFDSRFLNDLECLCMEVKFELISYKQIYHLIVAPFVSFVQVMYLDIMIARSRGIKEDNYYFSNIIKLYDELMKIREEIIEVKISSTNGANRKIESIVDSDSIEW